jgi:hypothetical protein
MTKLMRTALQRGRRAGLAGGVFLLAAISALLVIHPGGAAAGGGNRTTPNEANVARSTPGVQVSAAIDHMTAQNATDFPCITSTAFVDMPGMTVTFAIAGTINRNVVALFQSEFQNHDVAEIRVVVDGNVQPGPGDARSPVGFVSGNGTAGFNFITNKLRPGVTHTLTLQWHSAHGNQVCVDERSLIVLHH